MNKFLPDGKKDNKNLVEDKFCYTKARKENTVFDVGTVTPCYGSWSAAPFSRSKHKFNPLFIKKT